MAMFKCKMCGGALDVTEGASVCECEYCGTQQTVPKSHDDVTANLFNRANNLRIKSEFDKAQEIYEKIITQNPNEAEAYWGLILCKYGIEYVEDPATLKKLPTCHRTQLESVRTDEDYKLALENADSLQREVYEREAVEIDRLQRDILSIVRNEKPFDVFICYKESDDSGRRTQDSVLANDIYHQLTQEGYKVFYAAITLEDKLGQDYEPYIFAALNSAKVMLVLGTKPEYFNAVWVKNEWGRYLKLAKNDHNRLLIPCYRDMDAYDMPEEFSHLQAQDMSKIGFMQDLIRGIRKVISSDKPKKVNTQAAVQTSHSDIEPLLKRVEIFLQDGNWQSANEYCDRVLDRDPECAKAYFYMLMSELNIHTNNEFESAMLSDGISKYDNYKKAVRFSSDSEKKRLSELNFQTIYNFAEKKFKQATTDTEFRETAKIYKTISEFRDSSEKSVLCEQNALAYLYNNAEKAMKHAHKGEEYLNAAKQFAAINSFKDSNSMAQMCRKKAKDTFNDEKYNLAYKILRNNDSKEQSIRKAKEMFKEISGWKDADELVNECDK